MTRNKLEILSTLGDASAPSTRPRIRLAYRLTPLRLPGTERVEGIEFTVTGTDEVRRLDAGLVLTSIGYRGKPIADLPFDDDACVVPNDGGRVVDPATGAPVQGSYVAGWIKRGPTGFIGTNKSCAAQTVRELVADYNAGILADPAAKPAALDRLVRSRQPDVVDASGWAAIDAAERVRGGDDRPRDKFTAIPDMLAAAATAPTPPLSRRLLAGCCGRRRPTYEPLPMAALISSMLTSRTVWASDQWCPNGSSSDAVAIAPELILQRSDHGCSGIQRALELGVDVLGVLQVDGDRRAAERLRRHRLAVAHLGEVVVEHHQSAVDVQGGVDQPAVGPGNAAALGGTEGLDVEVDGRGGVVDDEVGCYEELGLVWHGFGPIDRSIAMYGCRLPVARKFID